MSACISTQGEYSEHETTPGEYTCVRCFVLDESRLRTDLDQALGVVGAVKALADRWESHARSFTSPVDLRVRQDWEHIVRSLRAVLEPVSGAVEGAGDGQMDCYEAFCAAHGHRIGDHDFCGRCGAPVAEHEQEVRAEEVVHRACEECGVEVHVANGWWVDDSDNAHELIDDDKADCMCGVYEYPMGEHLPPCPLAARTPEAGS